MDVSKLNSKQFAAVWSKLAHKIKEDPLKNFIRAKGFMNFSPSPAQTVFLKIVFGQELDPDKIYNIFVETSDDDGNFDLEYVGMTEYQIFFEITGRLYTDHKSITDKEVVNMIDLIIGRRGGKTTLCAMLAIYCSIINNWKPFLRKTPFATVLILSHSREFSDEVIDLIRNLLEDSQVLSRLKNKDRKNTASAINLKVPWVLNNGDIEYSRVQIRVGAASSRTTRGVAACAVLLDEIAFFNLDENLKETDYKIMKAVRPATKQFGDQAMVFKLSSPAIKQGVLYDEYRRWKEGTLPKNYIVFKCPSWVFNTILPKKEFVNEWKLDPDGFDSEYRANFVDSLSNFILPEFVDMAVLKGKNFLPPDSEAVMYKAAIDAAYKSDRFTFSLVGLVNDRVVQFVSKGWKGSKKEPVKSFEVAEYVKNICKNFKIDEVAADQFAFQPLREIFERYGINLVEYTFSPTLKKKIYFNLKKLIHSQQADLLDSELQSKELKELIVEQSATGNIKIGHPSTGSDDFADSLAVASFRLTEDIGSGTMDFNTSISGQDRYGIETDVKGTAFSAPSADMLAESGHLPESVVDNSASYVKDPETGKLIHISQLDDDSEIDTEESDFIF